MADVLRIDLSFRTTREESLPEELVRQYVGGKGLGTHLLLSEIAPDVEPLGPQNKLILVLAPLAGTAMWGSNRYSAFFLSPQTGGYAESYSGGQLTPQFAKTGYKVVIVEGQSDSPVFLEISEDGAAFHPADDLWGLDAFEAENQMVARIPSPNAQACVIGPAGENLVRFANITNNKWHCLGRGGSGAVLGSKKVKGIVFHGSRSVEVARPAEFKALAKEMAQRSKTDPGVATLHHAGTMNVVRIANAHNMFPTRYWRRGRADKWEENLTIDVLRRRFSVTKATCPPCFIRCINHTRVTEGGHAGLELEGPEYETVFVFGGLCEIDDMAEIVRLNDVCDRLGMDTISAGNLCGLAIEASRRGLIDIDLDFGDAAGVAEFLAMMAGRTGVGTLFADGILRVETELGLEDVAVHVKGMEPAGYDPRVSKGMALGYMTTSRGACHPRATFFREEVQGTGSLQLRLGRGQGREVRGDRGPLLPDGLAHPVSLLP